ncbi:cytochrome c3 family protein [Ferrimonas sp. YFM]|uniref:cytochrome c3 family protein n=1 Tax=Ferrimonas sp. YFM TaxID=3028878 RepID=UPI0025743003|nr:cytochrome c3 family protein [Ferrimonas sp. YFM]BDY04182.1 hypothetical protein F0521_12230 [Ferrimonas sp. YFM]
MMRETQKWLAYAAMATALTACGGSDDKDTAETPEPPQVTDPNRPAERVFGPRPTHTMAGKSFNLYWNEGSGFYFYPGGMVITPPATRPIVITGDEVLQWLDQHHGGESIKNQYVKMFKPGNFTEFDALVYAAENRKQEICDRWGKAADCEVNLEYQWDPGRRSFDITINGDGNWMTAQDYDGGDETAVNNWGLEHIGYFRPDEILVKHKMNFGFAPYPQDEVEFYYQAQREEITRLEENGGKVIVAEIQVQTGMRLNSQMEFETRYIKEYNRANPYESVFTEERSEAQLDDNGQPMYHTGFMMEGMFISCGIEGLICWDYEPDYRIRNVEVKPHNLRPDYYYDGVVTMADVALSLNDVPGHSGSLILWPSLDTNTTVETYAINDIDGLYSSGFYGWNYNWSHKMLFEREGAPYQKLGQTPFDYSPHIVGDMAVLGSPDVMVFQYGDFYRSYYEVQEFLQGDEHDPYRLTRGSIAEPMAPLSEAHFGWKVANCGMCHTPKDMDYGKHPSLVDDRVIEPAKCAECHGNNGAPEGHDQKAGCYRCHFDMVGHGDAIEANFTAHPFEKLGKGQSATFPDPYSCVSCHANQQDVLVGGK